MTADSLLWEQLNMGSVNREVERMFPELGLDAETLLRQLLCGDIWGMLKTAGAQVMSSMRVEASEIRVLFAGILVLGILSALLSDFAELFQNRQVSDLVFFLTYLVFVVVLLGSFTKTAEIVREILTDVTAFMKLLIPTYMIAVGGSCGTVTAGSSYFWLMLLTMLVQGCFLELLYPAVAVYMLLSVINGIWLEEKLALLLELLEKGIGGAIKITVGVVSGFSVLQTMITPVLDSLQHTAMQKAAASIPGIGHLTEGMMELVLGSAVLIKNSIGIYITIVLLAICAAPVLKIALLAGTVKLGAAMIGIVSDKRMISCANRVGTGNLLLVKLTLAAVGIFIIQIAIIAAGTG